MNGLEAIDFMKNGGMVKGRTLFFRINDGIVQWSADGKSWHIEKMFHLDKEYTEYANALTGWERMELRKIVYYIDGCNDISTTCETLCSGDDKDFECANYFSTRNKAEEINFKQTLFRKLQRFSDENGGNEIDWEDLTENKYRISYNYYDANFKVVIACENRGQGCVYFISNEIAEKAIELFHDDLIKYFTHDWSKSNE